MGEKISISDETIFTLRKERENDIKQTFIRDNNLGIVDFTQIIYTPEPLSTSPLQEVYVQSLSPAPEKFPSEETITMITEMTLSSSAIVNSSSVENALQHIAVTQAAQEVITKGLVTRSRADTPIWIKEITMEPTRDSTSVQVLGGSYIAVLQILKEGRVASLSMIHMDKSKSDKKDPY